MSDEGVLGLIDTNVLVYAHDRSAGAKRDTARRLIQKLGEARNGRLSLQVLQEFFVVATQKIPNPLPADEAINILVDFGTWRLHEPVLEDLIAAGEIAGRYKIAFWDAMIIRSAQVLGCEVVWSEDLSDGQTYETVRVTNPFLPA